MAGSPTVGAWIAVLDRLFPPSWAEAWDNVGLQVGDPGWSTERVLVALDPTPEVVAEAADRGCGLLIAHHPLLFRPRSRIDPSTDAVSRAAALALRSEVAVVACHTNADVARPGVSDALADELGVEVTGVLQGTGAGRRVKLVVFVPGEATGKVLDAMAETGAGQIGEYSHCSFRVSGTGTFLPSERAAPAVGELGELNQEPEDRLEIVVPRERLGAVVQAMVAAHPYDEVAYDVYPMEGPTGFGLGRLGRLAEPLSTAELAGRAEERLGSAVRLAGDPGRTVERVALCGGAGASLIPDALRSGADCYLTGDVTHHEAQDAAGAGLTVIDAGHHGTERPFVPRLADRLDAAPDRPPGEVQVSETPTDPFAAP